MANNYVQFSTIIPCDEKAGKDLVKHIKKLYDKDECVPENYEYEPNEGGVWLSGDSGLDDAVVNLICQWQEKHKILPFFIEMALVCDKPRAGEFGGCVYAFVNGEVNAENTASIGEKLIQKMGNEGADKR